MTADKTMTSLVRSAALIATAISTGFVAGTAALAQQTTNQQQPQVTEKAKHGDWTVRCVQAQVQTPTANDNTTGKSDLQATPTTDETPATTTTPVEQCGMVQIARHPTQTNVALRVSVVKREVQGKSITQLQITAPLGVYLPFGVGVEIDGAAIGRLGYEVCLPPGVCTASSAMDDELLGKFKKGAASKLYVKDFSGRDSVFDLSLKGFTKAFDEL